MRPDGIVFVFGFALGYLVGGAQWIVYRAKRRQPKPKRPAYSGSWKGKA